MKVFIDIIKNTYIQCRIERPRRHFFALFLLIFLLPTLAQAQTDYSGVYYIGSVGWVAGSTSDNYYLCPTEGWCYYKATDDFDGNDTVMPFLTTYKCRAGSYDSTKAVWIVRKHTSEAYYYIIQAKTGKYLMANGQIRTTSNADRMRVHLEAVADPNDLDDKALFAITPYSTYLVISAKSSVGWNESSNPVNKWLTVNGGNKDNLVGNSGKAGGPGNTDAKYRWTAGIIGIYTQNDGNAKFYLDTVVRKPVISQDANGDVTITCATGNTTIYYTLNGSDPVVPADGTTDPTDPNTYKYTTSFSPAIGSTGVKAVAVLNVLHAAASKTAELEFSAYTSPVISFNNATNEVTITPMAGATIYYTTDGNNPVVGSLSTYNGAISISSATTIKAIAIHTGFLASSVETLEIGKVATPTSTVNPDNTISLSCATEGASLYYTLDGSTPTTGSTPYDWTPLSVGISGKTIKVLAVKANNINSDIYVSTPVTFTCAEPIFRRPDENTIVLSCSYPTSGWTIYYTIGEGGTEPADPTTSSSSGTSIDVTSMTFPVIVKAFATATDYNSSAIVTSTFGADLQQENGIYLIAADYDYDMFVIKVNNGGAANHYKLTADITISNVTTISTTFSGTLEAAINPVTKQPYSIKGLDAPIFSTLTGTVKNLMLRDVAISGYTGNTGAIACTANGSARIYNVGILDGEIGGTAYTGGLIGFLDGSARVINCFSYADITGGTNVGGIVGYNNVATTSSNLQTMVMNCMFYGDITGGSTISPIYGGTIISNAGADGVSNYNYFRLEAPYVRPTGVTYNCALGAEDRFLQRFEFYRHLLNSHREVTAWWVNSSSPDTSEIMKWVLLPDSIGTSHPYPILKKWGKYPSVVNIDAENAAENQIRNQGGKLGTLTVNIQMGDGAVYNRPTNAAIKDGKNQLTLNITDKDTAHFNFNYYKVQLPYYNDVGTKNYNGYRVVTGWKIVSIIGGTAGSFTTGSDATTDANGIITATPYNFADRNCTNKDLYSVSNRVFNQGAYWDVPEGVTAITIEPYWGKCAYLADTNADKVYNTDMTTGYAVPNVGGGQKYTNGNSYSIAGDNQVVFTTMGNAIASKGSGNALFQGVTGTPGSQTVYDYAVVLVGNYHFNGNLDASASKPFTVTSVDFDGDNEPDYSYILRFNSRQVVHPVRADFINIPGLGMAQKSTGGTGSYNFGIMIPKKWFEITNTSLCRFTQLEYEHKDKAETDALIVQGGVMEQWVSSNLESNGTSNKIPYIHVGGNVWFKEFHTGCHQDRDTVTLHPPISVTGGDYDEFYLTGLYVSCTKSKADNAECYINGGRFGTVCGAGMEGIGKADGADNTGNITWQIQNADIREFYAGALNAAKPATGNLSTTIIDSYVDIFCGGPKFGDMSTGKTVTTTATGCTFGTFFGAGYGGNSYNRRVPRNHNGVVNFPHNDGEGAGNHSSWNDWIDDYYTQEYNNTYGGVSTQFGYQFLPMSNNNNNVARIFVEYVKFSLATCRNVTSTLTGCTILNDFYGGGSLGKVEGPATSTLDSCIVNGNVYGAGFSASLPTVEVDSIGFKVEPYYYTELGTYRTGVKKPTTTYRWEEKTGSSWVNNTNHILYTTEDLSTLGQVMGNVTLTITGNSHIEGDVYGGGALSDANTNASNTTTVNILGGTYDGNIYGGGQGRLADVGNGIDAVAAKVNGVVTVNIGADEGGGSYSGNANLTASSVYGCNNTNGSPQADVFVNVYKTAQTVGINTVSDAGYAINQVFGGGNAANYAPENGAAASTKKATVHIYTCDNTVRRVFGGGNAAAAQGVVTIVDGGRFDWVFGGGNGEITAANIGNGGVALTVNGGTYNHLFNGSNKNGTIGGSVTATLTNSSGCEEDIKEYFCGNNLMPITTDLTTTIVCNTEHPIHITDLYGGSNLASITGNVTLTVEGGIIDNIYAGSKGTNETDATISGNVLLNIYGGTIGSAFGGSNINGTIGGTIVVNIFDDGDCPLSIDYVYGGGNKAPYSHSAGYPEVNIIKGTVNRDVFGGGLGTNAVVTGTPKVTIGAKKNDVAYPCSVGGDVFGGGNAAAISGGTNVEIINTAVIGGNVFGGGNAATVSGNTNVILKDRTKTYGNVYGGGNQGVVGGNTKVIVNGN